MGTISTGTLTTLLDSIAAGRLIFDAGLGVLGSEANTVSKAAANDVTTLAAVADLDVQADLSPIFRARAIGIKAAALYRTLNGSNLWFALEKHTAGLDAFLHTNNIRVSPVLKDIGFPLSPEQILPPQVDPMATFAVTAANEGTFADIADIDVTLYGRAWTEAVVTATIGGTEITATVNGVQRDMATAVSKSVVIPAGSSVGTAVNIGTLGVAADHYATVTSISIVGGTAGDAFKIRSRVERTISAVS